MRRFSGLAGVWVASLLIVPPVQAESRPLKQLPKDLVRWSTLWMTVPEQMMDVAVDYGPLAAVTWGPAKGTATMVERTTRDLWNATKPDKHPGAQRDPSRLKGPVFRYTF